MRDDRLETVSWVRVVLLLAALLVAVGPVVADVQCGDEDCVYIVVDQHKITEDPDPVLAWEGFTEELGHPINPGGEARGDGPLDMVIDLISGMPSVGSAESRCAVFLGSASARLTTATSSFRSNGFGKYS